MATKKLILGTRGSALALWQARHVAAELRRLHPGLTIEERIIRTEGDAQQVLPLAPGDRGVFVRQIEEAMLGGTIDIAVHSLKDLPTTQPDGLTIAAVPPRHDPRDTLLTRDGHDLESLPRGTVIGTGSFRRRAQLLHARPDLATEPIRGNVDTRLGRVRDGRSAAIVLALAGLERLGLDGVPSRPLPTSLCLPAVGQGALAIETRADDARARAAVATLEDPAARIAIDAERAFLRRLGGGCLAPAGAHAVLDGGRLVLDAVVADADGKELLRERQDAPADSADALGERLAERMIARGAERLLARPSIEPEG